MDAMDAMDAVDASAARVVELVGQVRPEQWSEPTPCTEWDVRTLVGHLIATRQGYCALLAGGSGAYRQPPGRRHRGESATWHAGNGQRYSRMGSGDCHRR